MSDVEYLLVLDEPLDETLDHLRAATKQVFSDRVVVVGPEDGEAALLRLPSIEAVVSSAAPGALDRLLSGFTPTERLLAEAWRDRNLEPASDEGHPGDGRAWDDPDFEAPDPPWARHV